MHFFFCLVPVSKMLTEKIRVGKMVFEVMESNENTVLEALAWSQE